MTVRSEEEIRKAFLELGECDDECPLDYKGDNFKYGMYIGKVIALGWALGDAVSSDLSIPYDFEGWIAERRRNRGPN